MSPCCLLMNALVIVAGCVFSCVPGISDSMEEGMSVLPSLKSAPPSCLHTPHHTSFLLLQTLLLAALSSVFLVAQLMALPVWLCIWIGIGTFKGTGMAVYICGTCVTSCSRHPLLLMKRGTLLSVATPVVLWQTPGSLLHFLARLLTLW